MTDKALERARALAERWTDEPLLKFDDYVNLLAASYEAYAAEAVREERGACLKPLVSSLDFLVRHAEGREAVYESGALNNCIKAIRARAEGGKGEK